MRAPALVGIVTALHIIGITALVSIQGCGTTRTTRVTPMPVEPPPPATMPPRVSQPTEPPALIPPTVGARTTPVAAEDRVGATYVIQKGDTLSQVAKRHGIGTRDLAEYNGLTNPNALRVGQKLVIPPYAKGPSSGGAVSAPKPAVPAVAGSGVYVVQAGDNLSKIAKRQGTSVSALKQVNNLTSDRILVGQKLALPKGIGSSSARAASVTTVRSTPRPAAATTPTPAPARSVTAEVDASVMDLDSLGIESIDVPGDSGAASTMPVPAIQEKPILYTVVDGDTVEEIAKLFIVSKSEILKLNDLEAGAELKPGTTIQIPPSAL